jgi:hypothetical protein
VYLRYLGRVYALCGGEWRVDREADEGKDFSVYVLRPSHRPASILAQQFLDVVGQLLAEDIEQLTRQSPLKID